MKLKKIASLALAGIMAVSMLAGCKDGGNSNSGSSSENTNTASGYSAMLGQKAAETLSKKDLDEVFTFADDSDDQNALKKIIVNNVVETDVEKLVKGITVSGTWNTAVNGIDSAFRTEIKADDYIANMNASSSQNTKTFANVWVANGEISMDTVMDKVFGDVKSYFENARKTDNSMTPAVNYSYDVSVSVENKPVKYDTTKSGSVNFIAVTVTRTAEVA